MSIVTQEQYDTSVELISKDDYDKALQILMKRNQYNKQYYLKRKEQHQKETKELRKSGRKPIEEVTPERAKVILEKYKMKCKRVKREPTVEEIKSSINQLFKKLKDKMP